MGYSSFLQSKSVQSIDTGIPEVPELNPMLYDFQRDIVSWALRKGRACIFADCGLGKTPMQLEWALRIPGKVLILAPLAVSKQTIREGEKFGIKVQHVRKHDDIDPESKIVITNYEMLHKFQPDYFNGIVLDESSILKAYAGKIRNAIVEAFKNTPFRLCCTATPAPNDFMELGNHCEFLGVMSRTEMLSMFFIHHGDETQKWRLKGHGQDMFWRWMAGWAVMLRKPSDLGYDDDGFNLPPIKFHQITVESKSTGGHLFPMPAATLAERRIARRDSVVERVKACANLINGDNTPWLAWCNLNRESLELVKQIDGAVEVTGSNTDEYKEKGALWFVGNICKCQLTRLKNSAKLAACGKKNTQKIDGSSMLKTKQKKSGDNNKDEAPKKIANTCDRGIVKIKNMSGNIGEKLPTSETREGGNSILKVPKKERHNNSSLNSGEETTQLKTLPIGLDNTESHQNNIMQPSTDKRGDVPFVENNRNDSVLTIATMKEDLEDCSVPNVTSGLESSKIISNISRLPSCTCGENNNRRVLVSKPSIFGFGLNFQHCSNVAFVGLSDSYEQFYQATRRCWRFGQTKEVNVYIIVSDAEGAVVANIKRKEKDADRMARMMVEHMQDLSSQEIRGTKRTEDKFKTDVKKADRWELRLGDCVEECAKLETDSIDYSIFSPPFASLYTYSASDRDMGNSKDDPEFAEHYGYLMTEMFRVIKPGRLMSFHCMNLPTSKTHHGYIGLRDFRGELIRQCVDLGWIFHSEVVIWKDPVVAMQRTKSIRLLHKQLVKDSTISANGIPDYVVTMRKPGDNEKPVAGKLAEFVGDPSTFKQTGDMSIDIWQRYASPIWSDIRATRTLQAAPGRAEDDEKHICPLQLDVIERCLQLWSNPGDLVLSPFAGIGSEGFVSIQMDRRFLGFELKESYWKQSIKNMRAAEDVLAQTRLL